MASTSTNPPPPPPSPLFDLLFTSSMDFMVSNPVRDSTSSSTLVLNNSSTTSCITNEYPHVEDLIHSLKYLINQALITVQVATKEEVDANTTLETLQSIMSGISRTANHSFECIAQTAVEDLRQLSLRSRELQKKLAKHSSRESYLEITSTVAVGAAAACVVPAGLIAVQPLSRLVSTLWKEWIINPLEEKIKVAETNRFMIHYLIIKIAKMKDVVQSLVSSVAKSKHDATEHHHDKKVLEELEKSLVDSIDHLKMVELELKIEYLL